MSRMDRSAAFWLRAFPRRWRVQRAAELAEVLTDLAPAGATRPDARAAAGLVRAGWGMRWRQRPSVGVFLRYRLLGRRPAPAYDGWLRDDLDGALYPWRAALVLAVVLEPAVLAVGLALDWPYLGGALVVGYLLAVLDRARGRAGEREALFGSPPEIGPMGPYRLLDR